jgi:hypothetical protein
MRKHPESFFEPLPRRSARSHVRLSPSGRPRAVPTGGRLVSGPAASGVAGNVYKTLSASNFYNREPKEISPAAMVNAVGTGSS